MILVLVYGLLKGGREAVKKKCLEKNTVPEVLFVYTLIGFLFLLPETGKALQMNFKFMPVIALKSSMIFVAWILSFRVIKNMPIGIYGILDMSRVLFATFLGVLVLGEKLSVFQMIGMPLVLLGLFLLRVLKSNAEDSEKVEIKYVIFAVISCLLNAISGLMDKIIMQKDITSAELQFWYMLLLVIFYGICYFFDKNRAPVKELRPNWWILLLAIMFVIGDRCLFIANGYEESKVTIMTLIKQSACFVTIALGYFVYKEKGIGKKVICAAVVLTGIVIAVL